MPTKVCKPIVNGNGARQDIFNRCILDRLEAVESTGGNKNYEYKQVTSATYTLTSSDYIVGVNTTVAVTLTLPAISSVNKIMYTIKDESLDNGSLDITINPNAADNIEDDTTLIIQRNGSKKGASITLYNDNVNDWYII